MSNRNVMTGWTSHRARRGGLAGTLAAAGAIVMLASGCGSTTRSPGEEASGTGGWTQARTAWGDPDLQGVWRYEATMPL